MLWEWSCSFVDLLVGHWAANQSINQPIYGLHVIYPIHDWTLSSHTAGFLLTRWIRKQFLHPYHFSSTLHLSYCSTQYILVFLTSPTFISPPSLPLSHSSHKSHLSSAFQLSSLQMHSLLHFNPLTFNKHLSSFMTALLNMSFPCKHFFGGVLAHSFLKKITIDNVLYKEREDKHKGREDIFRLRTLSLLHYFNYKSLKYIWNRISLKI